MSTASVLDRNLRYHRKQIEKLVYAVNVVLEQHISPQSCALLENAEIELNQLRAAYTDTVQQILQKCKDEEFDEKCESLTDAQDSLFEKCRTAIAKSKAEIGKFRGKKARESLASPVNSTEFPSYETNQHANTYPKIKIPSFDGDYRQFMRFKGIFVNLVHDEASIPNVHKLYYLQDALQGDAARLIEDLPMSDDSYAEAWSRITARYDNQKALVMIYFRELLAIRKISQPTELRLLLDTVTNALNNLKLCNLPADNWGDLVAYMVYQCLDNKTKDDFDNNQSESNKFFGWKPLHTFLKGRAYCSETRKLVDTAVAKFTSNSKNSKSHEKKKPSSDGKSNFMTVTREKCIACDENHLLIACQAFAAKTPKQRFELIAKNKMCSNCFSRSHPVRSCEARGSCKTCGQRHHTLLHFPKRSSMPPAVSDERTSSNQTVPAMPTGANSYPPATKQETEIKPAPARPPTSNLVKVCAKVAAPSKVIILPTAVVRIHLRNGSPITARILIDSCSQVNLISETFVRRFRLAVTPKADGNTSFTGAADGVVHVSSSCAVALSSRFSSFQLPIVADVVPHSSLKYGINGIRLPEACKCIKGFPLADPAFANDPLSVPAPDILIGAEYFELCMLNETKSFDTLTLRNSQFGWVVIGPIYAAKTEFCALTTSLPPCSLTICQIESQLRRFCELEEVEAPAESPSDQKSQCVRHFDETYSRHTDGKFVAYFPLSLPRELLINNFVRAQRNLFWSEKKRSPEVQPEYVEFMREYEKLRHMTPISFDNKLRADYLIPHHAVLRPESTTTRTRVVFNASSKTASGYSLNDLLMVGPTIQPDLMGTLLRFRQHKIAFTADIAKMYRCIWIHEDDRPLQCILWRESTDKPVTAYQLNTLTYGTSCASFIATKCLEVLSKSITDHPEAAFAISNHFYMDDLLSGANSLEECSSLQKRVHDTLASAGFVLRKYQSNSPELLASIDQSLVEKKGAKTMFDEDIASVLGVYWVSRLDSFNLRVSKPLENAAPITRRQLLSEISKIFDPLGFAAPFTIRGKIFMQRVWKESGAWDEPITSSLASDFSSYWRELSDLVKFNIPRAYSSLDGTLTRQLIGFCDASEVAYCAVVYLRCVDSNSKVSVNFVCAKTRVAPLKKVSIPRLELQAALLLAQLAERVAGVLGLELEQMIAFSDSQVVLSWLAKPPSTWTVFVRNRVSKIVEILPFVRWSYVNTSLNPADLATRGLSVDKFLNSSLWTTGPKFLFSDFSPVINVDDSLSLEKCKCKPVCNVSFFADLNNFSYIFDKFSSFLRVVRVFSYVLRFFNNCKSKIRTRELKIPPYSLTANELVNAENRIVFIIQRQFFADVFARLLQGLSIKKKSPLHALHPFIDEQQLLRVGGRLRNAELPFEKKHPLIIPAKCRVTELLISHLHVRFFHAQRSFLLAHLRAKFWFYGNLTSVVKKCIRNCVTCTRYDSQAASQLMGDLPLERVTVSRPFTRVGVDFAGPFTVKCVGHRSTIRFKSYIAIFVCLTTRALHLEVVSQLSTDHFLMCLSRFIARRGRPFLIWSDNGTNFVGAASYLNLSDAPIADFSSEQTIRWLFNPPRAPHRGGIWESAVKSMKKHLLRSTAGQTFTFEELNTIVAKIESILNSRPLLVKVDRNQEKLVITPAHFLIGDSLLSDPTPEASNSRLAKRFEIVSRVTEAVWKLWYRDYLTQLQSRYKWQTEMPNIAVGSIVVLKDPASAPNQWPLGKIEAVYPDAEGRVRTVSVLSGGTERRRDISAIIPLLEESCEQGVHPGEPVREQISH